MADKQTEDSKLEVEVADETVASTDKTGTEQIEGKTMFRLREALDKTVAKCLEKTSRYNLYAHNYKFAHRSNPKLLKSTIRQLNENLKALVQAEFDQMITEENIVSLCNKLDTVVDETSTSDSQTPAWRPSGNPDEDLCKHIMLAKLKEKDRLEKELEDLEKSSVKIQEAFSARKKHLLESQKNVKERVKRWSEATNVLQDSQAIEMQRIMCQMTDFTENQK